MSKLGGAGARFGTVIVYMWIAPICHLLVDTISLKKQNSPNLTVKCLNLSMRGREGGETIYQKAISNLTRAPAEMRNQRASEEGVVKNGAHNNNRRGEEAPSPTEAFSSFLSWQYNGRVRDFLIGSGKLLLGRSSIQALTWLDNVL